MTVKELAKELNFKILCDEGLQDKPVTGCYCGDLLSWVMSRATSGDAWLTVMGNINAIGVAVLADISCIILTESASFDEAALEKARQNSVFVFQTKKNTYETAVAVSRLI